MGLPVRDVVGILSDNLRLRKSVLPIPARQLGQLYSLGPAHLLELLPRLWWQVLMNGH